ncbi:MAG: SH3 domain-containing protein [Pseudomonadota bacterium]
MDRKGTRPLGRSALAALAGAAALAAMGPAGPATAEDVAPASAERRLGPETNLPLPRFVTLKAKANVRRGPGLTHRIDWVFTRKGMPLEVVAEHGHWRKVRDVDHDSGWVHHALLSGARSAVVVAASAGLRRAPEPDAPLVAVAEAGAIVALDSCEGEWCEVESGDLGGYALKTELWGARPEEAFD